MVLQFAPHSSLVQPTFWHKLTSLKLDVLKLDDASVPISGTYTVGRFIADRENEGKVIGIDSPIIVGEESFSSTTGHESASVPPPFTVSLSGSVKNFNTIEEFKLADKTKLFNDFADLIWSSTLQTRSTKRLGEFLLITFADLKKYKYLYWFTFPAFTASPGWEISEGGWAEAQNDIALQGVWEQLREGKHKYFLLVDRKTVKPVEDYEQYKDHDPIIGFIDPSTDPQHPGWPLRNLLTFLNVLHSAHDVRVLRWRDSEPPRGEKGVWKSLLGRLTLPLQTPREGRPAAVGWERNASAKLAPRLTDLSSQMDPSALASQAVNLNLSLMRWRIVPTLDLPKIAATKCLLLGAGTLGCSVARTLMGWGISNITFVDYGKVSYSNPVRQNLFHFSDAVEGRNKAECAAERCKDVWPGVNATGYTISIPMPGHPIAPSEIEQTKKDAAKLDELISDADVVYLLMDSRESRWLPTVIGRAKNKLVINAALGFDTYLVMRHGALSSKPPNDLGCYYCNDIVAPTDSLSDRTLDQMCTVTRPGIASIAASTAVELTVSVISHPDGVRAPAPSPPSTSKTNSAPADDQSNLEGPLGQIPHQIRGFLSQFRNINIVGARYDKCTGCGPSVVSAYEAEGFDFLLRVFNEEKYLEKVTGLDQMYKEAEAALVGIDGIDELDEEGDDF